MNKKIISNFLALALLLTSAGTALGAKSDIDTHWAKDSFLHLADMNIINGYDDGTFRPDAKITRAEFFKIINTTANVSRNEGSAFSDVAVKAWYKNVIDKAFTAKYASGYDDGTFKPEANITRCEAAVAICKAFGGDIDGEMSFTDNDKIPAWAKDYINILTSAGIITGYKDGSFGPSAYITRAETATIFDRFAGELYTKAVDATDTAFEKPLVIGVSDVTFKNATFEKDIYIGPGVAGGEIRFIDCNIKGNVYIAPRNNAGVVFEDTDAGKICVNSVEPVKLVLTGSSVIDNVVLRSQCNLMEMNTDKGAKTVTVYTNSELSGTFDEVIVAGGSGVNLTSGEIEKLTINSDTSPQIESMGKINSVDAKTGGTVNGKKLAAGTETDEVGTKSDNVKYSYTLALLNGDISDSDPSVGGARTDIREEKDSTLTDLTISAGTMTPPFSPSVKEYTVSVPSNAGKVVINPVTSGALEVKVRDKTIGEDGYTVGDFSNATQSIDFEVYSELMLKNTYTVTVNSYGTDDTAISTVTANLPYETTKSDDGKYSVKLTGNIDYSSGKIPVTITVVPINPNSKIEIDSVAGSSKEFDLYENRQLSANVTVISEDGSNTETYEVSIERDKIPAIDSADSQSVDGMLSNPDTMTMEKLDKAKITGAKSEKLDKYKIYLAKIAYHAEGLELDDKQQIIQKAIDAVNEYDGKIIRIEIENIFKGAANQIKTFLDENGKVVNLVENISTDLDLPEGDFEIRVRSAGSFWQKRQCNIQLNGTTVYSQLSGGSFGQVANDLYASKFGVVAQTVSVNEGKNTLTILQQSNLYCDYVELEMEFKTE
ncbi:MAG: S-layer homology domain-containing protein [Clostridia bacterium]|nr:S-layer homology domain-containing protein [Clostridia bacterium]